MPHSVAGYDFMLVAGMYFVFVVVWIVWMRGVGHNTADPHF